ncbi:MAG: hypothetical protein ACFFAT_17240 [Promethearchaeota archaeon]
MELFQVFWDDHKNLFLEFKKNKEDKRLIVPEEIKRFNIKYELLKIGQKDLYCKEMPIIVSIKDFFISDDLVLFSIDLDLLMFQDDLQINFLTLTIFFQSGRKIEISINEEYEISEICINEEEISSLYKKKDFPEENTAKTSVTQERLIKEVSKDIENNRERSTIIYEKKHVENISGSKTYIELARESNDRLKNVELYLKDISESLKQMRFNGISSGPQIIQGIDNQNITRIRRIPPKSLGYGPPRRLAFLGELKEVFGNVMKDKEVLNFRDILKPMTEEELNSITLDAEVLKKKELESFTRKMKKIEDKNSEPIKLENLKKPG